MAGEISVTGNKKIKTLKKEFTKKFPYICISGFPLSEKGKNTQNPHNSDRKISEVRTKNNPGNISLNGRTHVGTLEKNFEKIFGLYAQVGYKDSEGKNWFTGTSYDKDSLTQMNKTGESNGWKKGGW